MNWCATIPNSEGPLSRHQKYFLQSRGCGKNPSSSHLKSVPESGVVGGAGVVVVDVLTTRLREEYSSYFAVVAAATDGWGLGRLGLFFLRDDDLLGAAVVVVVLFVASGLDDSRKLLELKGINEF